MPVNTGIARYTKELYQHYRANQVSIEPVVYNTMHEPGFFALDKSVRDMQRKQQAPIPISWQRRSAFLGLFQLAEMMDEHPLQIDRFPISPVWAIQVLDKYKRRSLRLFGRRYPSPLAYIPWRLLNGVFYRRVVFPSYTRWNIYHSPFPPLPPVSWTGQAIRVLTVHDCIHLKFADMAPELPAPVGKSLQSVDTTRDYVICDSECTRRDMLEFLPIAPERTRVIPLAASDLFNHPRRELAYPLLQAEGIRPGQYILVLGQLEPRKNLLTLARAFRDAYQQGDLQDYVLLIVVTRGAYRTALLKQLTALGLPEAALRIVVDIPDEMLAALYACAGLFAYVSLYEGFGIPPLEAMAAGCPVVASHTSSLPEVVGQAGAYVDPVDIRAIAATMTRVLQQETLRASLIERGKQQAAQFSWQKTAALTLDFYQEIYETNRQLI